MGKEQWGREELRVECERGGTEWKQQGEKGEIYGDTSSKSKMTMAKGMPGSQNIPGRASVWKALF